MGQNGNGWDEMEMEMGWKSFAGMKVLITAFCDVRLSVGMDCQRLSVTKSHCECYILMQSY